MKRIFLYLTVAALAMMAMAACSKSEDSFDRSNLYSGSGQWTFTRSGEQMLHKFNSDGTGYEVNQTQSTPQQAFTWELSGSRLTFIHTIEMGGAAPEDFTVETLTDVKLVYKDNWGKRFSCTKVHNVE